jgi:hypothetical protein
MENLKFPSTDLSKTSPPPRTNKKHRIIFNYDEDFPSTIPTQKIPTAEHHQSPTTTETPQTSQTSSLVTPTTTKWTQPSMDTSEMTSTILTTLREEMKIFLQSEVESAVKSAMQEIKVEMREMMKEQVREIVSELKQMMIDNVKQHMATISTPQQNQYSPHQYVPSPIYTPQYFPQYRQPDQQYPIPQQTTQTPNFASLASIHLMSSADRTGH